MGFDTTCWKDVDVVWDRVGFARERPRVRTREGLVFSDGGVGYWFCNAFCSLLVGKKKIVKCKKKDFDSPVVMHDMSFRVWGNGFLHTYMFSWSW